VIRAQLSRNGIERPHGNASFLNPHHMQVTSSRGQSRIGSGPHRHRHGHETAVSPLVPFNDKTIINSESDPAYAEIPKSMIVVGRRVIGVEYVCMFATLGVRVTLIESARAWLEFA